MSTEGVIPINRHKPSKGIDLTPPNGQWQPGGRGRPPAKAEVAYLEEFKKKCTVERFGELVEKVFAMALEGDLEAAKLIFSKAIPPARAGILAGAGENGVVNVIVVSPDELAERKEALRNAYVK